MKKSLFAVLVAMLFATTAFAQYTVKAGYTLSTQTAKLKEDNVTYKEDPFNMSGIYLGASYEFPLLSKPWGDVSVNPGLTYSFYGKTVADESETIAGVKTSARESVYEHYLDLPVHGKYTYDLIPGKLKLSGYAGPVLSFGLASTNVSRIKAGDNWAVERVNNYNGNSRSRSEYNGEKSSEKHKGIGTKLLQTAENGMRARGITTALVHLGEPKEQWFESYAFYPRNGYREYAPRYMRKTL